MKTLRWLLILGFSSLSLFIFPNVEEVSGDQTLDEKTRIKIQLMEQDAAFLRRENERLKKELKHYQLQEMVKRFQKDVSRIRGLEAKAPLQTSFLTKDDVREYVLREIDRQYPGDRLEHYQNVLIRLGFIPQGTNIKEVVLSLYTEQAAGFYDDMTKRFYVVEDYDLNDMMTGIILAHEICHVLQDQHFPIDTEGLYKKNNDDEIYAILSVLEGDATILMTEWLRENFTFMSVFQLLSALGLDQTQYNEAPYFLQQLLIFPYLQGSIFMMEIIAHGGEDARNAPLRNPPRSTEQILHPEKYYRIIDEPTTVSLPGIRDLLGKGWELKFENVFGEIGFKLLFEQYMSSGEAADSAAGWDGDRYALYEDGKGKFLILWDSCWDSDHDAFEASNALDQVKKKRYPPQDGSDSSIAQWVSKIEGNYLRLTLTNEKSLATRIMEVSFVK